MKVRDIANVLCLLVGTNQFVVQPALVLASLRVCLYRFHNFVADGLGELGNLLGNVLALRLGSYRGENLIDLAAGK